MSATGIRQSHGYLAPGAGHTWTPENRLRHARFTGIRTDKDARQVVHESRALARLNISKC